MAKLIIFSLLLYSCLLQAQEDRFYLRTTSEKVEIPVSTKDSIVTYLGNDARLKELFAEHRVKIFRKEFKYAQRDKLKRTYFIIAESKTFKEELMNLAPDLFEFAENISNESLQIYEPNDYGITSTTGKNLGAQAVLDYYDFLGVPQAWHYTTGSPEVIIGISDGYIDPEDPEFAGKTTMFKKSSLSKGHGFTIAAIAAARGDNGYGAAGVCYDCNVYTTTYGNFKELGQLLELSRAGAKVINCSWGSRTYYETAQEAINEMSDLGTVIVSVPHNAAYSVTNGEQLRYPGAYKHVISVGSVQHKNDEIADGLLIEEKNGKHYAEKQQYHLSRTGGFKNNDPNDEYTLYLSSTNNLDSTVDIVAPGNDIFQYYNYKENGEVFHNPFQATSPAAPLVTGTIGLMFSLNPSLSVDEVNSIIKLSATNIDHIKANAPLKGLWGAGSLHTGRAVKMTHDMLQPNTYMMIENQRFARWNFKINAAHKIMIKNQQFIEDARVDFTAKDEILINAETVLLPGKNGSIMLTIDSNASYNLETTKE
ncbi:hypothetical protein DCS32_01370 [Dokdonia sp. Dokd-P16]|uniref:S8 family peptidase n=1 Tax=Dokdonia sp. Dokd-P16 TaxID=2173169 RepID=UPI000D54470A|nr:S8/S53 family peptidase [Dokdonia sp. Dokd-P16]AWH72854.1 hypothetical protein DCS32_01370 [Dokdonia sp. Dokd-P16]